ncbi:hypothetical protein BS47DRAFT_1376983 [Hydnum rufescens UP504]|uniref:Nuclear protein Es2 n=1 Tax=Hydnum rufescens UP504 TaxID=1448309 RepID=A0A9P6AX05_9AGAM|nr:hypothetical protein BS47DRAFT_1376983 [Hydnum rufescens UP504]
MSTPRSSALSKSTSGALITTQKPPLSLNKQRLLPSLAHLDATNSYLSALDSQDTQLIEQSVRRLAELGNTPQHRASWAQHTPYARTPSDTPLRTPSASEFSRQSKRPRYDTSLSLDAFQAKYTSEDNASFTDILDEENRQRKEKWWWAWEAERKASERKAKELQGRERLLLEARGEALNDQHRIEGSQTLAIEASDERPAHELMIRPKLADTTSVGTEPVDVMAPRKDTRVASVPGWRFKNRNALMFAPDADVSPYHSQADPTSNATPTTGDPKVVKHANTRLPTQSESDAASSVPPSPTRSRIGAAISGTPYHSRVDDTPKVNGFGFVDALPSPSPSQLGPAAMKELMTWGTLLGTPRMVSSDDPASLPGPSPFRITQPSSRDDLGRKLGSKAGKSLREKAALLSSTSATPRKRKSAGDGDMPPPMFTPRRADMLSPAGRNLLSRTKGGLATLGHTPLRQEVTRGSIEERQAAKRAGELDLRKVGWSPMPSPVPSGRRG